MYSPITSHGVQGFRAAVSAAAGADGVARLLEEGGAVVSRFEQGPRPSERPIDGFLGELQAGEITDVIFFSAQGVRLLYELARQAAREAAVVGALRSMRVIALGGRTERALAEIGLKSDVRARGRGTEALLEALAKLDLRGRVVALQPRDLSDDTALLEHLERAGAKVRTRSRPHPADEAAKALIEQIVAAEFDGLVLSDTGEVTWLFDAALAAGGAGALRDALAGMVVVANDSAIAALRDRGVRAHSAPNGAIDRTERLEDILPFLRSVPAAE
jgi:uroporphyrinogen-III synthase